MLPIPLYIWVFFHNLGNRLNINRFYAYLWFHISIFYIFKKSKERRPNDSFTQHIWTFYGKWCATSSDEISRLVVTHIKIYYSECVCVCVIKSRFIFQSNQLYMKQSTSNNNKNMNEWMKKCPKGFVEMYLFFFYFLFFFFFCRHRTQFLLENN